MSRWKYIGSAIVVLLVVFLCDDTLCSPGIESVRSLYGIEGSQNFTFLNRGYTQEYPVSVSKKADEGRGRILEGKDYEVAGRSLLEPIQQSTVSEAREVSPMQSGKCFREVLTSSLVKGHVRVPVGNSSNPALSIIETCCDDFEPYVHNTSLCIPICKNGCTNGWCIAPNVCQCFPDHVRSLNNDCVPTCPIGCLNGQCDWQGTCFCKSGYILAQHRSYCVPWCSRVCGEFSNCTAPEQCTCVKGYKLNLQNGKCEPECNPACCNGQCISPGVCSCLSGFALKNFTCQANCTRGCEGGRCVANEVCSCDSGWILDQTGIKCIPHCPSGCPHGTCTSPGNCKCSDGYHKMGTSCKPSCPRGCKHGTCTAPNECTCKFGYYLNAWGTKCKPLEISDFEPNFPPSEPVYNPPFVAYPIPSPPISSPPLYNVPVIVQPVPPQAPHPSLSNAPFFAGPIKPSAPQPPLRVEYEKQPAFNPNYNPNPASAPELEKQEHAHSSLSRQPAFNPFYNTPTTNRNRTIHQSENTTRRKYYQTTRSQNFTKPSFKLGSSRNSTHQDKPVRTTTMRTAPVCSRHCLNGRCTGRDQCTCNMGYAMDAGSTHKCTPHCGNGCPNHQSCISPGHCACKLGYKKRNNVCERI